MKKMVCEICGGGELVKENGLFVCRGCGAQYSPEEARALLTEVAEEAAPAAPARNSRLENLYTLARRAKKQDNWREAAKYYGEILPEAPNDWEAAFYSVYYTAFQTKLGQIGSAAKSVSACLMTVFGLIKANVPEEKQRDCYLEVGQRTVLLACAMTDSACKLTFPESYCARESAIKMPMSAAQKIHSVFGDAAASKLVLDGASILCKKTDIDPVDQEMEKLLKKFAPLAERCRKERNERYWAAHAEEQAALEAEQGKLVEQVNAIHAEREQKTEQKKQEFRESPEFAAASELEEKHKALSAKLESLGMFKGKERRAVQAELDALAPARKEALDALALLKKNTESQLRALEAEEAEKTAPLEARFKEIDEELRKDR